MSAVAADETYDEVVFTCPRCGGHEFGTSFDDIKLAHDVNSGEGTCHSYVPVLSPGGPVSPATIGSRPCGFTWPRRDDAKYFTPTGRKLPRECVGTVDVE